MRTGPGESGGPGPGDAGNETFTVEVPAELEPLIPGFLEKRENELEAMREALEGSDLENLSRFGHRLKGTAGGYGFEGLTDLGKALEDAAEGGDLAGAKEAVEGIERYLGGVEVTYVEE